MDPIETSQRRPIAPDLLDGSAKWPLQVESQPSLITLKTLVLSSSTLVEGSPEGTSVGTLHGVTPGSVLTLRDSAGGRFQLSGSDIEAGQSTTDYHAATSHSLVVRETHESAGNSPVDSALTIEILSTAEQRVLSDLVIDKNSVSEGTAVTISIEGALAGSDLTLKRGALPAGLILNSSERNITGTPLYQEVATFTLQESFHGSPNSPKETAFAVMVTAADREAPLITSPNPSGNYAGKSHISGTLTADDEVSWSIRGADAEHIDLDAISGKWLLNFPDRTSLAWSFVASDRSGNLAEQSVFITIDQDDIEANDPPHPLAIGAPYRFAAKNLPDVKIGELESGPYQFRYTEKA